MRSTRSTTLPRCILLSEEAGRIKNQVFRIKYLSDLNFFMGRLAPPTQMMVYGIGTAALILGVSFNLPHVVIGTLIGGEAIGLYDVKADQAAVSLVRRYIPF